MQSKHLSFEQLTAEHAEALFSILTTPNVLSFIDPEHQPTLAELQSEYAMRSRGPVASLSPERWFNFAIRLKDFPAPFIGRLEATGYGKWGEVAYLLGEAWWGKGLAFEAMLWFQAYLDATIPKTEWWATTHPKNQRSIRLLNRLGYVQETDPKNRPNIQSYDLGDLCFVRLN